MFHLRIRYANGTLVTRPMVALRYYIVYNTFIAPPPNVTAGLLVKAVTRTAVSGLSNAIYELDVITYGALFSTILPDSDAIHIFVSGSNSAILITPVNDVTFAVRGLTDDQMPNPFWYGVTMVWLWYMVIVEPVYPPAMYVGVVP